MAKAWGNSPATCKARWIGNIPKRLWGCKWLAVLLALRLWLWLRPRLLLLRPRLASLCGLLRGSAQARLQGALKALFRDTARALATRAAKRL